MPVFSSPAILLRRLDYGDFDVIITFFTLKKGKLSLIAKSAKKSTKRFAGILELFSVLEIVAGTGRNKGLSVLQEAVLKQPFSAIRADFRKTAYASYWAELIYNWIEENFKQVALFHLFEHVLAASRQRTDSTSRFKYLISNEVFDTCRVSSKFGRVQRVQE